MKQSNVKQKNSVKSRINTKNASLLMLAVPLSACGGKNDDDPEPTENNAPPPAAPPPAADPDFIENPTNVFVARDNTGRTLTEGSNSANLTVTGGAGNDTIVTGSGVDMIRAGNGADIINAGAGDDLIILVGTTTAGQYNNTSITNSGGSGHDLSSVINLANLNGRTISEVQPGEIINGGGGTNTLFIYGAVDLTGVTLSNVTVLVVNSDVTLTPAQLAQFTTVDGDGSSVINIEIPAGSSDTYILDLSALNIADVSNINIDGDITVRIDDENDLNGVGTISSGAGDKLTLEVSGDGGATEIDISNIADTFDNIDTIDVSSDVTLNLDSASDIIDLGLDEISGDGDVETSGDPDVVDALDDLMVDDNVNVDLPTISINDVTIDENAQTTTFTVTLSESWGQTVTVDYNAPDGSNGTLTFNPGETSKTFGTNWTDDNLVEDDETHQATLSAPSGALISDGTGILTIQDDDPADFDETSPNTFTDINNGASTFNGSTVTDDLVVSGGQGNDIITTGSGNDIVEGGAGADILDGGAGIDTLSYENSPGGVSVALDGLGFSDGWGSSNDAEDDTINNFEILIGSEFDDDFITYNVDGTAYGRGGDDNLSGGKGNNLLYGEDGNDMLVTVSGTNILDGGAGNDEFFGGSGADTINGGTGDDLIKWADIFDTIDGGDGVDTVDVSHFLSTINLSNLTVSNVEIVSAAHATPLDITVNADGVIDYTDESNTLRIIADEGDTITTQTNWTYGQNETIDGITYFRFTSGGATLYVSVDIGTLNGFPDVILGFSETSLNIWEADNDANSIFGGTDSNENLTVTGKAGNDVITTGSGNDIVYGGDGNDILDGGNGVDTLTFTDSPDAVTISLIGESVGPGEIDGDEFQNFEILRGSQFSDLLSARNGITTVYGDGGSDTIYGSSTDDTLYGGDGYDWIHGGDGNDRIDGGDGGDTLDGGNGRDELTYATSTHAVTVNIHGSGTATGGGSVDNISNFEVIRGSAFDDILDSTGPEITFYGGAGNDTLDGTLGNDFLYGGDGDDLLIGNAGNDFLSGNDGNDTLFGYLGIDFMNGDAGNDELYANDLDSIYDDQFDGGLGNDTFVVMVGPSPTIDMANLNAINFESIDLTATTNVQLEFTLQSILDFTDDNNQLIIDGGADDNVISTGQGWIQGTDQAVDGITYHSYTSGAGTLLIDEDITQTIS